MFNWLRRRIWTRRQSLFRYWDGRRLRSGDAIAIYAKLTSVGDGSYRTNIEAIRREIPNSKNYFEACLALGEIAGIAFDLPDLDSRRGHGLVTVERLELLTLFMNFIHGTIGRLRLTFRPDGEVVFPPLSPRPGVC